MKSRAVALVTYGQVLLAIFLALCVALHPGFVLKANEGGMSNYAIHAKTVAAYTLSLGFPMLFSFLATRLFLGNGESLDQYRQLLRCYAWLLFLTLVSSYVYSLNTALRDLHIVIGAALAIFQVIASAWMYRLLRQRLDGALLAVELVGFVLAVLTIFGALHVLFLTQVLTSGAFAVLLVRSALKLDTRSRVPGIT
jgi:heme/copper-type cytochrome/quinol oxidase subunit 4